MAVKYYCDECGKQVTQETRCVYKQGDKYAMHLHIGATIAKTTTLGPAITGIVDLCTDCKLEVIKELLNVK